MIIKLDDSYHIKVNDNSFDLIRSKTITKEKSKNYGETVLSTEGYYSTFPQAVLSYIEKTQAESTEEKTLKQYIEDFNSKCDEVIRKLEDLINED